MNAKTENKSKKVFLCESCNTNWPVEFFEKCPNCETETDNYVEEPKVEPEVEVEKEEDIKETLIQKTIDGIMSEESIVLSESNSTEDEEPESRNKKDVEDSLEKNSSNNFTVWVLVNIVMGIVVIYGFDILQTQQFSDKTGISYVIIILFGLFYVLNIANTFYYREQQKLIFDSDMPTFNYNYNEIQFDGEGVLAEHIANLSKIYDNLFDGQVSQDKSLDVLANRLLRREYFVQLGSNIMITLGLIGTITGLIISITGLENVMTSLADSGTGIIPGLKQALSGMGTAFYTTLFGAILGGFFLKILHLSTSNIAEEVIDEIALISEIHVLPHLKISVEKNTNAKTNQLLEYVTKSREVLDSETEKMNSHMNAIFDLNNSIERFNDKIEEVEKEMDGTHLTVLKKISKTLEQIQEDSKPILKRLFK